VRQKYQYTANRSWQFLAGVSNCVKVARQEISSTQLTDHLADFQARCVSNCTQKRYETRLDPGTGHVEHRLPTEGLEEHNRCIHIRHHCSYHYEDFQRYTVAASPSHATCTGLDGDGKGQTEDPDRRPNLRGPGYHIEKSTVRYLSVMSGTKLTS
ncbi:hypothetical protein J6590_070776, partial [Homalodisca vitripennis]